MVAGPQNLSSKPTSGTDGIYLNGNSYLQTQNGNINLWAANEVLVATGSPGSVMNNGIRTVAGGNISVVTQYGNVNSGEIPWATFSRQRHPTILFRPMNSLGQALGGISTAAGGNVTISAGKDVLSYLPVASSGQSAAADAGSGAFGAEPGNVTITAGGNVYGHYVVANGVGTMTAGQNVGSSVVSKNLALSLIKGSWSVNAPHGNIYLQEVRNPNGVFNNVRNARLLRPATTCSTTVPKTRSRSTPVVVFTLPALAFLVRMTRYPSFTRHS